MNLVRTVHWLADTWSGCSATGITSWGSLGLGLVKVWVKEITTRVELEDFATFFLKLKKEGQTAWKLLKINTAFQITFNSTSVIKQLSAQNDA